MDKDLKRIIDETVNKFFDNICLCDKTSINENEEYTEDGGVTWKHTKCKKFIYEDAIHSMDKYLHDLRKYKSQSTPTPETPDNPLGVKNPNPDFDEPTDENVVGLPPSGEEKYNKQEPGGTMGAINL